MVIAKSDLPRSNKLSIFYDMEMFNSHVYLIKRHEYILSAYFILENEVGTDPLDNIEPSEVISLGVCRSELSVNTLKTGPTTLLDF